MTQLGKAYTDLPKWAKGIVFVAGTLAVVAVAITIKNMIKGKKTQKDSRTWKGEENELAKKLTASFSDAQMTAFANQIYEGVRYGAGDDYPLVRDIMKKMKNDLDVARLVRFYGTRQLYNFGIPVGEPIDLFTTMEKELGNEWGGLSKSKITEINADWKQKGITYTL